MKHYDGELPRPPFTRARFVARGTTMTDWQEKYMRLRDEHSDLKLAFNAKLEEVKRTNGQLTKIENLLKVKDKMDAAGGGGYGASVARADNDKIIKKLYDEKAALAARNAEQDKRLAKLRETRPIA